MPNPCSLSPVKPQEPGRLFVLAFADELTAFSLREVLCQMEEERDRNRRRGSKRAVRVGHPQSELLLFERVHSHRHRKDAQPRLLPLCLHEFRDRRGALDPRIVEGEPDHEAVRHCSVETFKVSLTPVRLSMRTGPR